MKEMLQFYKNVEDKGFKWDLVIGEHVHQDVEFVPYTAFIKCDTKEADLNCGLFGSQGENVSQLFQKCCCPTKESDNPEADYPLKTQENDGGPCCPEGHGRTSIAFPETHS